jgi:hypothetical protein
MNILKSALVATAMLASFGAAQAQTALEVEPAQIQELAECQAAALAQVKTYSALSAMMRGARPVAIDETTKVLLDHTADSFSVYASTRLADAETMDKLAAQIFAGSNNDAYYKLVVGSRAQALVTRVLNSTFGPLPSSGPTEDLADNTDRCYDLVSSIRSNLKRHQD